MDFKKEIAKRIKIEGISPEQIETCFSAPPSTQMGDLALPCFNFAKVLKKAPQMIAQDLGQDLQELPFVEKTEAINGYLNIYFDRKYFCEDLMLNLSKNDFYHQNIGQGKKACVEYSSVNLAKFMHIGHYNCTILGESIARMYEFFGYDVVRINYIGDYGTPFGKMVVAYKLWGDKQKVEQNGIDEIQNLYVKFNREENDELMTLARQASKNIEDKQGEDYQIYQWFIQISKQKVEDIISRLGIKFDDWRGESYYNDKMKNVKDELENAGLLKQSEGAKIVDLSDMGLGICVVERSDGGSLYITRDLAAVEDRFERYNFDKLVYITAVQQDSHFEKLFTLCKLLNKPYSDKLLHVGYGMFSTPEGKIASRKGKQAVLEDILAEAKQKALDIIKDRGFEPEQMDKVAETIAQGAMAFSIFKVETTKDKVFDLQTAISFDGETAPYIQYTYARILSVIKKSGCVADYQNFDIYSDDIAYDLLKDLQDLRNCIYNAFLGSEPSIIARKVLHICSLFNQYYNKEKIVGGNFESQKIALCTMINKAIKTSLNLLCINVVDAM